MKAYPVGTIFYAEGSKMYWGVIEVIEKSAPRIHLGVLHPAPREYRLVNDSEEIILFPEEAIPFSMREVKDMGLELQKLEACIVNDTRAPREADMLCLAMRKAMLKESKVA